MTPGPLKRYTEQAEVFYQQSVYQDSSSQLKRALHDKQQVRTEGSCHEQLQQDYSWLHLNYTPKL